MSTKYAYAAIAVPYVTKYVTGSIICVYVWWFLIKKRCNNKHELTSQLYSNHVNRASTPNCTDIMPKPTHERAFAFRPAFISNSIRFCVFNLIVYHHRHRWEASAARIYEKGIIFFQLESRTNENSIFATQNKLANNWIWNFHSVAYFDSLWNNFSNKICYLPSPMVLVLNLKALIARVVRVLDESGTRQHEEPHRA